MYTPPFTISAEAINMIAQISAQIERYAIRLERDDALHLRKANRIRTIHSSLAIEGNTLTEDEVRDIINGKTIVAPIREIQEVKNAIKTYEMFPHLNPFSEEDLLRAHAQMMEAIIDNPGRYRRAGVGVFSEHGLVHMAPPAERVPSLMADLFAWLRQSKDHLLIRSCVFHYEFEFIHPFADGNGRMGRLWQSLILGKLHPLFEHLPIENMVYANQQAYYDAIAASTHAADSGAFIDFMLAEILETLRQHQGAEKRETDESDKTDVAVNVAVKGVDGLTERQRDILRIIGGESSVNDKDVAVNVAVNTKTLAERLGLSRKTLQRELAWLQQRGIIRWVGAAKNGHWEIAPKVSAVGR